MKSFLLLLYAASGIAALAYEVLWMRVVAQLMGVSIFGVVATVAAFMAGLGIGCLAISRSMLTAESSLRLFAAIEGLIALYALLLPFMLQAMDQWLGVWAAGTPLAAWYTVQGGMLFALLAVPALGMGAGFSLMLRAARDRCSLGALYGVNTLGGVVGALLPLLLLPLLGWTTSLRLVALLGLVIAAAALVFSRRFPRQGAAHAPADHVRPPTGHLLAYGGIGAASLMLEIGWTRLYGMVMLRTEYVLAVVVAVFLAGIGLGSILARRLDAMAWLPRLPLLAALFALASVFVLPPLAAWAESMQAGSLAGAMAKQAGAIALCILPTTLLLGAWLPLLGRLAGRAHAGAWFYGANSVGGALGALLAGFLLLPIAGSTGLICIAAVLLFAFGMTWVRTPWVWAGLPLLILLAFPVFRLPPAATLLPQQLAGGKDRMHYEDAVSITHVVDLPDGRRLLLDDLQRTDASSEPTAVAIQKNQARLPLLLHPDARTILLLGLGTGITAAGSLPWQGLERTAVELSRGAIIAANDHFQALNRPVMERLRVVHDDARRFLKRSNRRFDVIVGDLFHPDMVGRSNLLSVQQFARIRRHLSAGGVYVQWLALNQFDIRNLQVVMASFRQVFPAAVAFVDGFHMALAGFAQGKVDAGRILAQADRVSQARLQAMTGGEGLWTWLGRYWGPLPDADVPVQDEWSPVIEFSLPRLRYGSQDANFVALLRWLQRWRQSPKEAAERLRVPRAKRKVFTRAYAASSLNIAAFIAAYHGAMERSQRLMRLAYRANPRDRWAGFALADRMFATLDDALAQGYGREEALRAVLAVRPDHIGALKSLYRLVRDQGRAREAEQLRQRIRMLSPLDAEAGRMTPDLSGRMIQSLR